jgi:diguanylate cyclase (GGDEF)-like protein
VRHQLAVLQRQLARGGSVSIRSNGRSERRPKTQADRLATDTVTVTVSNGAGTVGVVVAPAASRDDQAQLSIDLNEAVTHDIPSVGQLLAIIQDRLSGPCDVHAATVLTVDPDDGSLAVAATHGDAAPDDVTTAGQALRSFAGTTRVLDGERTAIRLRICGQTVGILVLTGTRITALRTDVAASIALQLASALHVLAAEQHRQHVAHTTTTIHRLFDDGTAATSVEDAGTLLARATGEAFRTEYAAVTLVGPDGLIYFAVGVGIDEQMNEQLRRTMIGKTAAESPLWQAMQKHGPLLIDDIHQTTVRQGGFAQTMKLRSFVVMPLLSAAGPVGMVLCGDSSGTRRWSRRDHTLARRIAVEGALIVDSARMRQDAARHIAELTRQAQHDALTGLPNRTRLMERAGQAAEIATATNTRLALLMLDLDGFKQINDTLGHHCGDALLHVVGRRLQDAVRDHDVVARLGGDEFAILLTHDPDEGSAFEIAERIHTRLREPFDIEGADIRVGASIGISHFPTDADDIAALMRGADTAMYEAKRGGGGVRMTR